MSCKHGKLLRATGMLVGCLILGTPDAPAQLPPILDGQPILFVTRKQYSADHHNTHTMFPAEQYETNTGSYTGGSSALTPGRFYVMDVYTGTHMAGINRGDVKWLRVVESPEKRYYSSATWSAQGIEAPGVNWDSFETKRVLGTVPVEPDGSAHFLAPPDTFLYFQLLDENKMMLQSMRSGTVIQPGESQCCIGCHENRGTAPQYLGSQMPLAFQRDPDTGAWPATPTTCTTAATITAGCSASWSRPGWRAA